MQSGRLADYAIWRPGAPDGVGDLHVGRVLAKVPAMAGAFVALEDGEAFLPDSDSPDGVSQGDHLAVRVTRAAQGGKGPRVTAFLTDLERPLTAGRPVRRLRRGPSPLDLLAARHPEAAVATDDAALAVGLRATHGDRATRIPVAFDDALEGEVAALAAAEAPLPGGMRATFSPTPALTAIDMDAGAAAASRLAKAAAQFAANRAALPELARQIRLRNLSGAILVDFAGMPARRRPLLGPDLAAALAADPLRPRLVGFSQLGFAEILRPRGHPPLHERLGGPHAAGLEALRQAARASSTAGAPRLVLCANPAVIAALQADPAALQDLARVALHPILLDRDPAMPPDGWRLEHRHA